jgi:hypothetical protein
MENTYVAKGKGKSGCNTKLWFDACGRGTGGGCKAIIAYKALHDLCLGSMLMLLLATDYNRS